jgi:hypothetical protein
MLPLFSELSLATIRNYSEHFVEYRQTPCPNFLRTATKICFQAPMCRMCISAVPMTIKVGLTNVGNHGKPLEYSEEKMDFLPIYSGCSNVQPLT